MGWLRLVGSIKLLVSFAKEPYNRDEILQKRPVIFSSVRVCGEKLYSLEFKTKDVVMMRVRCGSKLLYERVLQCCSVL